MSRPPLPPDDDVTRLVPVDARGAVTELRHPEAINVRHGVTWSRLGRADLAWQWWDRVDAPSLAPWIDAERGRVLRELGLHAEAEQYDTRALEHAIDLVDVARARIGLVADAVGQANLDAVPLLFTAARSLVDALPDGPRVARQRLRASWVAVEIAFLLGETPRPDDLPAWHEDRPVYPDDYAHGTDFHRAKGLLFAGVVHEDLRLLDAARDLAPPVLRWAVELARADRGDTAALPAARAAWQEVVPPPDYAERVAATPTARRLRDPSADTRRRQRPRSLGSSTRRPSA